MKTAYQVTATDETTDQSETRSFGRREAALVWLAAQQQRGRFCRMDRIDYTPTRMTSHDDH